MNKSAWAALALAALALSALAWLVSSDRTIDPSLVSSPETPVGAQPTDGGAIIPITEPTEVRGAGADATRSSAVALAPSLAGADIDGQIRFDDNGALIADRELRRLFDFLLTTLGEVNLIDLRFQLAQIALEAGDAPQSQQVLDAFERYLSYLRATESVTGSDLGLRLEALAALRREWLGSAMADAFFGDEEAYARASLERASVLADATLDPETRRARLNAMDAGLDPRLLATRANATAHLDVVAENRVFDELSVGAETRYQLRSAQYGEATADRLADLDGQRRAWTARADEYFEAIRDLDAQPDLTNEARRTAINALEAGYTEAELRRLAALARISTRARPTP